MLSPLRKLDIRYKVASAKGKLEYECIRIRSHMPDWSWNHLTFYRLHCAYFLAIIILGTSILYAAHRRDTGERQYSVVDSIFNTVSVVTVTGLTSVRIATFSSFDRVLLLTLMTLGSPVFTSLLPLYVRCFYFFRRHQKYAIDCQRITSGQKDVVKNRQKPEIPLLNLSPITSSNPGAPPRSEKFACLDEESASGSTCRNPASLWNCDDSEDTARSLFAHRCDRDQTPESKALKYSSNSSHDSVHLNPEYFEIESGKEHKRLAMADRDESKTKPNNVKTFTQLKMSASSFDATIPSPEKENRRVLASENMTREKFSRQDPETCTVSGHEARGSSSKPQVDDVIDSESISASYSPFKKSMEHQALVALGWLVPSYLIVTQLVSFVLSLIIFHFNQKAERILQERNLNTFYFSVSTTVAAFTNSGFPAHDDNMVPFRSQCLLLLLYTVVSLMGNLLYPPCLRLAIWVLQSLASDSGPAPMARKKLVYSYLLDHPRRCFTHLFPRKQSIWLCLTVIGFTAFQFVFFCALDWHSYALAGLDPLPKVVDGIYQSVSVRNAGGAVVGISGLASSMLVLYVFMMFVAAYPVVLLRQNSTEYEQEQTELGICNNKNQREERRGESMEDSLAFQFRKLMAKDSVFLCITLFVICLTESKNITNDPLNYSIFNIIFEVVSAYGGVGMSLGYSCKLRLAHKHGTDKDAIPCTDVPYSFSGKWSPRGRIILAITMFIGRHRGLPHDIDSAIKLPSFTNIQPTTLPAGLSTAKSPDTGTSPSLVPSPTSNQP